MKYEYREIINGVSDMIKVINDIRKTKELSIKKLEKGLEIKTLLLFE
jgi:hypothetical protein